jgi:hypothetical protein
MARALGAPRHRNALTTRPSHERQRTVEARAALLIAAAPDPATQGNVILHFVKELTEAEYDRYAEAYKALDGIRFNPETPG